MILRRDGDGLLCVRQTEHAELSGWMAERWGGAYPPLEPADSVVVAARRHDDGWSDFDDDGPDHDPGTGRPYDYRSQPLDERLEVSERSVTRVAAADPYAGWLVSRHFASFHEASEVPAVVDWIVAQVGLRARLLARARRRVSERALHPHVLEANLDWLQLLDALSLALCEGWDSWTSRPLAREAGEAREAVHFDRVGPEAELAIVGRVSPWPFIDRRIESSVVARRLDAVRWDDADVLARAWTRAPETRLEVALEAG